MGFCEKSNAISGRRLNFHLDGASSHAANHYGRARTIVAFRPLDRNGFPPEPPAEPDYLE